ncbi:phage minor capsid protein [Caloramator sp. ALD01]|uniref:phage minor capsid protein n=1 Tax=Caloramator sp. ALD01 TaxID=1031288 RepID=UPI000416265D|nr:phage minor capsid protein [Caloramator sp. ALD01]
MPYDVEKQIQALVEIYRQGFIEVLKVLLQKEAKKQNTVFYKDQLKQIMQILNQIDKDAAKWIQEVIPQVYQDNYTQVLAYINKVGMQKDIRPEFAQIHQRAIDVIAQNMYDNLRQATQFAGRKINDYYRQAALEVSAKKYSSGQTIKDMTKELQQKLLTQGLTGFKDKLGREWRLDRYAEMVARTTTAEIASVATLNTCEEAGIDLVKMTTHYPTCEKCAPLQGKVFSISGKDKRYPKLEDRYRPPVHPNCYSKDTEVYTINGWKLIKDVQVGDECLSLNPETLEMEFVKVIDTVSYKAEKLIHFYHKHFDMMVTFNHLCLWQNDEARKKYGLNKGWRFIEAQELLNNNSGRFLRVGYWRGKDIGKIKIGNFELTGEQYAKLMGWFLSEGSCDHKLKRIQIAQSKNKNQQKWLEIKDLLDEIGCSYSYNNERFVIYCGLYDYFKQFGKSYEKYVPDEIKNANSKIIRVFLDTFRKGDGSERKTNKYKDGNFDNEKIYFTSSKRLADGIGELILKVGKRPSFYFAKRKGKLIGFSNGEYEIKTDIWIIRECNSETSALSNLHREIIEYNDYVYCVELEKYHTLYVRRNGKCVWSGNCRHSIHPYVREFDDNAEETERFSNISLSKDPRNEKEKEAYKEIRDKVTIQSNRRKAREVLYNENAPLLEKIKAAEKLKKSYEKTGTKPVGKDASIINQHKEYIEKLNLSNIVNIDEKSGIITIQGRRIPKEAIPNAVIDLKIEDKIIQRRIFDNKGFPKLDIDLTDHNKPWAHAKPHAHDWVNGERNKKWRKLNEDEYNSIKDLLVGDEDGI